ncbi:MAG: hypothetical protein U9R27_05380 [Campylobacterota bacterium]|nr:hypothetical protein [Campylobacterota bacterium]
MLEKIKSDEKIGELIKSVFDMDLSIDGDWGYTKESATIIKRVDMPIEQLEHTVASMRTHLEMSIMCTKEDRYGGINLNERDRREHHEGSQLYHKVTYATSAIKESDYNAFIEEYKEFYGKKDFDISEYFDRRREATLNKIETYWFEILSQ